MTRTDNIRNEHIRGTTIVVQTYKKIIEILLKWCGHVRRTKEEHIVRIILCDHASEKKKRTAKPKT